MRVAQKNKSSKKIIIALIAVFAVCIACALFYIQVNKDKSNPDNVPTIQKSTETNNTTETENETNSNNSNSSNTPTKTEGKTPAQYENEKIDDTPAYDNEQFRIPEEDIE